MSWLRRSPALPALAFGAVTRLTLFVAVWMSLRAIDRLGYYPAQLPDSFLPDHSSLDGWARWDAAHYVALARFGYGPDNPSQGDGLGFLPLFPISMRSLVEISGAVRSDAAFAVAGILIANIVFAVALILMVSLAQGSVSERAALIATMLFAVSPFSFFFSAAYSESLFLAICLGTLLLADRGKWTAAATIAGFASAARIAGLFLAPALAYGAYRAGIRGWRLFWSFFGPATGFLLWSMYTWWRFDDPIAYFNAQALWGGWDEHVRHYLNLLVHDPTAYVRGDPRNTIILFNLVIAVLYLVLLPRVWKSTSPTVALFTTGIVIGHLLTTWVSLGRYMLPAVGVYIAAGSLMDTENESLPVRETVIVVSAIAMTTLAILFAHGFWIV